MGSFCLNSSQVYALEGGRDLYALCEGIWTDQELSPGLTSTEARLVCGDQSGEGPTAEAWREVPFNQAQFHLKGFLQSRAYYFPEFETRQNRLIVRLGKSTRVSAFRISGAPPELEVERWQKILDEKLTPNLLNEAEAWIKGQLASLGYPCAEVKSEADPETGVVMVHVKANGLRYFGRILEEPIEGTGAGMFRRYDAFREGDRYHADWLQLASRRIIEEGLVQSIYFTTECVDSETTLIRQMTTAGPPRLLRLGFGVNTEDYLITRALWRSVRLGKSASIAEVIGTVSFRQQMLATRLEWYPKEEPSRFFIEPAIELSHQNVPQYETLNAIAALHPGTSYDNDRFRLSFRAGPSLSWTRTLRGVGNEDTVQVFMDTQTEWKSHAYEFFQASPRSGYWTTLQTRSSTSSIISEFTAQVIRWQGKVLWNVQEKDPPWLILGARAGISLTLSPEPVGAAERLPPTLLNFLGGSKDLRGFSLQELPATSSGAASEIGSRTSVFFSTEARLANRLPFGLQPIILFDLGALGRNGGQLSSPLFYSPGVGIRWESPIGVVRSTLAHGFVAGQPDSPASHLQFFFSFGEEF